ncbi:glycosyltransferase [Polynucleobacter paneuropaeus]|nr:glycosyltransferase [Polynucleobacter paneuropaeus]QWD20105.1 glycosyltransferase [Polynucleobacter paneuropaeus]
MLALKSLPYKIELRRSVSNSFAIVTANFNMGLSLEETIKSVIANMEAGDQYYIVDGGSEDNSLDIIRKYQSHLAGWISEKDQGYADAIAKGFKNTESTFQCWINSGDLFLPGALHMARNILQNSSVDFIFGDDLYIDQAGKVIQVTNGYVSDLRSYMLYGGWTPLQDACFWRKDLYEKVGGINSDLKNAADYDLFLRMALQGKCEYTPIIFSAFRKHDGQKSINNVNEYKRERSNSRRIQLDEIYARKPFYKKFITFIYWFKVRWRVRVFEKKSKSSAFESLSAHEIHAH